MEPNQMGTNILSPSYFLTRLLSGTSLDTRGNWGRFAASRVDGLRCARGTDISLTHLALSCMTSRE